MTYTINIAGLERQLPLCPVGEDRYIAAFVIFGDVELTIAAAKALLAMAPDYDYLIAPEAKGIPLLYEMARQSGAESYFLARKGAKLYMQEVFETSVRSITTDKVQHLFLDKADADRMRGKRILLIDDVISTGESLQALETLVIQAGGIVAGRMAILAEGKAAQRQDIQFLAPLPLFHKDGRPYAAE